MTQVLWQKFEHLDWTLDYAALPLGGLVLANVRHDDYQMARDIRIVRIWVYPVDADKEPQSFYLGSDELPYETPEASVQTFPKPEAFSAPPPYDIYTKPGAGGPGGLRAKYKTKKKVFGDDKDEDDDYLSITQTFIFTRYGKNPPHEPGGVLEAVRLFPLIKFSYGGKRIKSIRIDYRFHISLDIFLYTRAGLLDPILDNDVLKLMPAEKIRNVLVGLTKSRPMLAGIFRDKEGTPSGPTTESLFDAAEKPVLWEVIGYGLLNGLPGRKITKKRETPLTPGGPPITGYEVADDDKLTWDNLHMWANFRVGNTYLKKQPSAPGAFHAFHCHWRWPYIIQHPSMLDRITIFLGGLVFSPVPYLKEVGADFISPRDPYTSALGAKQFRGIPLRDNIGGPLLDHRIPVQTIRFAITKSTPPKEIKDQDRWDAVRCPSEQKFADLFFDSKAQPPAEPRNISGGENLVTWLSITVENKLTKSIPLDKAAINLSEKKFEGTVMVHGLYFAHNAELPWGQGATRMTVDEELQKPEKPKGYKPTWLRTPNGK